MKALFFSEGSAKASSIQHLFERSRGMTSGGGLMMTFSCVFSGRFTMKTKELKLRTADKIAIFSPDFCRCRVKFFGNTQPLASGM